MKDKENGRSMIEMLGVLAIIGVLSIGGIAGYSKAMAKYKLNKAQDQIFIIITNVRTYYAGKGGYGGLDNLEAIKLNIAPSDMLPNAENTSANGIRSAFGGKVNIKTVDDNVGQFSIEFQDIGTETCISLMSTDWGTDGLVSIATGSLTAGAGELPIAPSIAAANCKSGGINNITWTFY